jgi:hypothetical protein
LEGIIYRRGPEFLNVTSLKHANGRTKMVVKVLGSDGWTHNCDPNEDSFVQVPGEFSIYHDLSGMTADFIT